MVKGYVFLIFLLLIGGSLHAAEGLFVTLPGRMPVFLD